MKALDCYRDVKRELDKYGSPTFSIGDFNYFSNLGVSRYIDQNYRKFDMLMKEIDDLRSITLLNQTLTLDSTGKVTLPTLYRHMLHSKVQVKFIASVGKYRVNDIVQFYPERAKSGQKGFRSQNAYSRPSYRRYYYEISGDTFYLLYDSNYVEIVDSGTNLWVDYVKQPDNIFLNPDTSANYNQENNNSTLFYNTHATIRNHVYYEIIREIRSVFLENIESPRAEVAMAEAARQ